MHLLVGDVGRIDAGDTAIDLGQSPGEIVVLSAADTELALLALAAERRAEGPTFRLCNLMRLSHPMSVDLYLDKTASGARLVVVRMMGGAGYWTYGLEGLRALARGGGPRLVVVSGDDRWDAALEGFATESPAACRRLWRYLVEGGAANAGRALDYMAHLIGAAADPDAAETLPRCGCYRPGEGAVDLAAAVAALPAGVPVVPIVFYRSVLQGGATAPIDALAAALTEEGIAAMPIFVASLKDGESRDFLHTAFEAAPPAIVLNTTAFAVSAIGASHRGTVLDAPGRPVLQVILAGSSEAEWRDSPRGLLPRDLTMNVVLPEVDGRIGTRAVSFKAEAYDAATDSRVASYQPVADRVRLVAAQAAAWVQLGRKPAKDRRIAVVLSNYPNRASRIGNAVGLDTMASAVALAEAMREAGYRVEGFSEDGDGLAALLSAPSDDGRGEWESTRSAGASFEARRSRGEHLRMREGGFPQGRLAEGRDDGPSIEGEHQLPHPEVLREAEPRRTHDASPGQGWSSEFLDGGAYAAFLATLPEAARAAVTARWGAPEADPSFRDNGFAINARRYGNVVLAVQPSRGGEEKASLHDGDLVPPHGYLAFHAWLREAFAADAIVHLGKHGNLEWLPGKALALSAECWPELCLGETPLIYPFIVNDPGEGAQAKRRTSAVIVDHLMPPMTRAELHGPLAALETLVDEYALAAGVDRRRAEHLEREIVATATAAGLDRDLGLTRVGDGETLQALDAYLCDLKEMQIRDGLHVLGAAPGGQARVDTLVAIARTPRTGGRPADASLHRAIAADLGLAGFDPLDCDPAAAWDGPRQAVLAALSDAPWRTVGDTVERIEMLAVQVAGEGCWTDLGASFEARAAPEHLRMREGVDLHQRRNRPATQAGELHHPHPEVLREAEPRRTHNVDPTPRNDGEGEWLGNRTTAVLAWIRDDLAPALDASGKAEIDAILAALDGRFVRPGPSGSATRGRPEVLPTGRNFYTVDIRAVPTAAAWALGRAAADAMALRYFQDEGEWPRSVAMSAWGTSNMRTGGDDIAEVLALIGAEPVWEAGTGRVTGFRVMALSELGRPRIDVTLRISGMFRDAFPEQIELMASAFRAVAALDEDATANPIAASARKGDGEARIFGARPGAYGAGIEAIIDQGGWETRSDLADAFLRWGGHAYGGGSAGADAGPEFAARLAAVDAVLHSQDNREHDILDSADYAEFQGGLAAVVETLRGAAPRVYHADHSRPETPVVRDLGEEIGRVVRGRATNLKWIAGMMRHGYRGAMEMATAVDLLFAYAALTDAVGDHHFDQLYEAYVVDDRARDFIAVANPGALCDIAARFREAIVRGLWTPRANSVHERLSALAGMRKEAAE